jgi:plasmid maintenance system antidote protein VapI
MKKNGMRPVPPGEVLNEEFLKPLGLTANAREGDRGPA